MGVRKHHTYNSFDAYGFKTSVSAGYVEVVKRLRAEREGLGLRGIDVAEMVDMAPSTYYEVEEGKYSIQNDKMKIMYDNGFDFDYIFTGTRQIESPLKSKLTSYNDREIKNLLKAMCSFVKDFKVSYESLKKICDLKDNMFYIISNCDEERNVYQVCKEYYDYTQEEMAYRFGCSLNMVKKRKVQTFTVLDSRRIYTVYKGLEIPPLMFINERAYNINELVTLAEMLEKDALTELKKMNLTLYNILFSE
jgi:transcriptional regulator with XRE-family HTH domain